MDHGYKTGRLEILLSCLIPIVGLNSCWRFHMMVYENGGGAFWYAYLIIMWTIGISLHYMAVSLGQFTSEFGLNLFSKFGIGFSGISVTQAYTCLIISAYYCTLSSYILIYIQYSLETDHSWSKCQKNWGEGCIPLSQTTATSNKNYTSSADYFFMYAVLGDLSQNNKLEYLHWKLVFCSIITITIVMLYMSMRPLQVSITSISLIIVPFILLCVLTGIAASMKHGIRGMTHFLLPDFSYLKKIDMWYNAISHCLLSVGEGLGILSMSSSQNHFSLNLKWITIVVVFVEVFETFLAGLITFAVLSRLSISIGRDLSTVIRSNSGGIAFIAYSVVLYETSEISFIIATIFFFTLYVSTLYFIAILFQYVSEVVSQFYPSYKNTTLLVCASYCFLSSFWFAKFNGIYTIKLFNNFCIPILVIITVLIKLIGILFCYGLPNFSLDLQFMFGKKTNSFLKINWILSTFILLGVSITYLLTYKIEETIIYGKIVSCVVLVIGLLPLPFFIIYHCYVNRNLSCKERYQKLFDNTTFGPQKSEIREAWSIFKEEELEKRYER